jgi:hypothetical protein
MAHVIVKIMTEVLSVLALATKQIEQGRFSKKLYFPTITTRGLNLMQRNSQRNCWESTRSRPCYRGWTDLRRTRLE